jgi:hypothetical protein
MVELIINNKLIELPKSASVKYTKQISDIFDIANVAVSYTNTFEFEKTPANTQAMQFLGISGDRSNVPYQRNIVALKVDGFDLISEGWFIPTNTEDNYKGAVYDGMIDFFKAIENKTIGSDLDLKNFNHEKLVSTVAASFTNEYYNYIIGDYGGKNLYLEGINIDYQAPSFSVRKLWELIFSTFGFNCDYTNLGYIDGLYITYPKDTSEGQDNELIFTGVKNAYITNQYSVVGGIAEPTSEYNWDSTTIIEGSVQTDNWSFVCPETTSYFIELSIEQYAIFRRPNYKNENVATRIDVLKNGIIAGSILSDYSANFDGSERTLEFNITCSEGDVINIKTSIPASLSFRGRNYRLLEFRLNSLNFNIYKTDLGTTNLENEFKDFLIKDFIKEILWRTALTPVYNKITNTVEFRTIESRIDFANAQDLSDYFVRRTNESYTNGYGQKNIFALKKNDDTDLTGDGYLYVPNKNIDDEKILANSKIYAPDKKIVTDKWFSIKSNQYKIWQLEVKEDENFAPDTTRISYKGLSGRFYFIRKQIQTLSDGSDYKLISEKLNDEIEVPWIPVAINTNTLFEEAIYNSYSEYQKIFDNFRIHNVDLALSVDGFNALDLTRPIYIKQENAYYICNKVPFEEGQNSNAEFIKINNL